MNNKTAEEIRKKIIKDFTKFLKENNVYMLYKNNLAKSTAPQRKYLYFTYGLQERYMSGRNTFDFYAAQNFINSAFAWTSTRQGHGFWRKLNIKWESFITCKYYHYRTLLEN